MSHHPSIAIPVLEYAPPKLHRHLLKWVKRLAAIILVVAVGGGIGYGLAWQLAPRHYVSQTVVYFEQRALSSSAGSDPFTAIAATMESSPFIALARTAPAAQGLTALDWQAGTLSTSVDRKTDLISVSVQHTDPSKAVQMAKAVLEVSPTASSSILVVVEPPRPPTTLRPIRDRGYLLAGTLLGTAAAMAFALVLFSHGNPHSSLSKER